jgi:hypothetical protein
MAPGEEFQVTVTFTSPHSDVNGIGLTDIAPAGWSVSVNKTWCTPGANEDNKPTPNQAEYLWFGGPGVYPAGTGFTAVYKVQVPTAATPGTYTFPDGKLEYYVGSAGPYVVAITGDNQVEVGLPYPIAFATDPAGIGTITFAGVGYSHGASANKTVGNYAIVANPGSGYSFVSWNATGLVSVASSTSATTTCTVSGAGTLRMVLTPTAPVGGTAYPPNKLLMLLPWIALGAAIIIATSLLVRRTPQRYGLE